ncbi:MAG: nucleotidyltransferase family protein [Lachnospiraceae bacterium]|nr:nucleotidyltransferase family protein [Lachnospiraceae bacterium]
MKVTAVIAEYNPLHNGHVRHINAAREATGADFLLAVMSGDFVQRGGPAVVSKYERTRAVLMSGADLVLELPVEYSAGSLEFFAAGAVSLIQSLGIVDCISFGSECGDTELLKEASDHIEFVTLPGPSAGTCILNRHDQSVVSGSTEAYDPVKTPCMSNIRDSLSRGINYSEAVNSDDGIPGHIRDILRLPNNLLGAAYIKAAKLLSFDCEFHTLRRTGSDYHDDSAGALSSSALRMELLNPLTAGFYTGDQHSTDLHNVTGSELLTDPGVNQSGPASEKRLQFLSSRMPGNVYGSLCEYLNKYPAMSEDDMSLLLFYKLQTFEADPEALTCFLDVSSSMAYKIVREYAHASSFSDLCMKLKSKDLNYARISRALTHILLDIRTADVRKYSEEGRHYYIRPLGLCSSSSAIMHELKLHSDVPIISKNADAPSVLRKYFPDETRYHHALSMFRRGILTSDLYNKTACSKCRQLFISEYERSPVIL